MATADVSEYSELPRDASGAVMRLCNEPSIVDQQLTIGSEVKSAAFKGSYIRVHVDADCRVLIGADPTASSTSMRIASGTTEYFGVTPGSKISIVSAAAADALLVEAGNELLVEAGDELLVE
jgi:hypothetical protein